MNNLEIFNNAEFGAVRTVVIDNEPWLVGKDVAECLGYSNSSKAVMVHVDDEDKRKEMLTADSQNGNVVTETTIINESGLYSLVLGSKLPEAKKFKRWVTSEVIPQIRKTGAYKLPQTYSQALLELAKEVEAREKAEALALEMKPKADFFDAVADSKTAVGMNDVAKVLNFKGFGRNKMFEFLRNQGVLMSDNIPKQHYVDCGWFRVIEQKYQRNGETCINFKTLVYQKGIGGIRNLLIKAGETPCKA